MVWNGFREILERILAASARNLRSEGVLARLTVLRQSTTAVVGLPDATKSQHTHPARDADEMAGRWAKAQGADHRSVDGQDRGVRGAVPTPRSAPTGPLTS